MKQLVQQVAGPFIRLRRIEKFFLLAFLIGTTVHFLLSVRSW